MEVIGAAEEEEGDVVAQLALFVVEATWLLRENVKALDLAVAETVLPIGTFRRHVGAMAHQLLTAVEVEGMGVVHLPT